MNKQISTLIILATFISFTTHAMEGYKNTIYTMGYSTNYKSTDLNTIINKYPRPKRKKTNQELMQEIINDNSRGCDIMRDALISSIKYQLKLQAIIAQ
jgi:hypothetical protein